LEGEDIIGERKEPAVWIRTNGAGRRAKPKERAHMAGKP
jgi:hypothetical protein